MSAYLKDQIQQNFFDINKKFHPSKYKSHITLTLFVKAAFDNQYEIHEASYLIFNNMLQPSMCKVCDKQAKFKGFNRGYNKTCSKACAGRLVANDTLIKQKKVKTNLEKYGGIHWTKNEEKIKDFVKLQHENGSYIKGQETFLKNYGVSNRFELESVKQKIKETNLEKYGVANPMQNKEIKQKMHDTKLEKYGCIAWNPTQTRLTNLEKYGVANVQQIPEIKQKTKDTNLEKYGTSAFNHTQGKATNLERYGVENPSQRLDIREKIKESNLERYGVEYQSQRLEIQEKIKDTNLKRYGVEHHFQNNVIKQQIKDTNLERYGVEYPLQNKEIFEKAQHKRHRFKSFLSPLGNTIWYQGYEKYVIEYFFEAGISESDLTNTRSEVPTIDYVYEGKHKKYFPDFYIKSKNMLVEVKSSYTFNNELEKNIAKQDASKNAGFNHIIIVWSVKNNNIETII